MAVNKHKVHRYVPKNQGVIHAVQWTGKAECLIGLPDLNEVITAIEKIDGKGLLLITCTGDEDNTQVRPNQDYVVVNAFGEIEVYTAEFVQDNFDPVPEKAPYEPYTESPPFDTDLGLQ